MNNIYCISEPQVTDSASAAPTISTPELKPETPQMDEACAINVESENKEETPKAN